MKEPQLPLAAMTDSLALSFFLDSPMLLVSGDFSRYNPAGVHLVDQQHEREMLCPRRH